LLRRAIFRNCMKILGDWCWRCKCCGCGWCVWGLCVICLCAGVFLMVLNVPAFADIFVCCGYQRVIIATNKVLSYPFLLFRACMGTVKCWVEVCTRLSVPNFFFGGLVVNQRTTTQFCVLFFCFCVFVIGNEKKCFSDLNFFVCTEFSQKCSAQRLSFQMKLVNPDLCCLKIVTT
jgi:hypothetical protein